MSGQIAMWKFSWWTAVCASRTTQCQAKDHSYTIQTATRVL